MNEQIQKLAEQAGWMMSDEVEGFNIRLEKFAELLVQECTAPQKREWVGLTEEELRDALHTCPHDTVENLRVRWLYAKEFARAIEAAHGIGEQK